MTESEFNDRIDETFRALESSLDALDSGPDYENSGGVLTVEFDNGSSMVFSRQPAARQLWLAARSGGFHFTWDAAVDDWRCTRDGFLSIFGISSDSSVAGDVVPRERLGWHR